MPNSFALPPGSSPPRPLGRPPTLYWPVVAAVGCLALLGVVGVTLLAWHARRPTAPSGEALAAVAATPQVPEAPVAVEPVVAPPEPPPAPEPMKSAAPPATPPVVVTPPAPPRMPEVVEKPRAAVTSAPPPEVPAASEPGPRPFKHRRRLAVDDLCRQLLLVPELELDAVPGSSNKILRTAARNPRDQAVHLVPDLLVKRTDLVGLPMRMGLDCQLGKESAENLQVLSRKLRIYLSQSVPRDGIDTRPDAIALRRQLLEGADAARHDWEQAEAVPTLTQLLQPEDKPLRLLLVELVSRIKGPGATHALVQRALFDLCDEVREAAVTALRDRPQEEYRTPLLEGFRYPWPAVADHTAEALVALRSRDALPQLVRLLDERDPTLPTVPAAPGGKPGTPVVRELVRVNHLRNCLLCHAPSLDTNEPVRGLVPTPGQPLPPAFSPQYYVAATGTFVRADITYLKQDFSVPQPVARAEAWPTSQRFDYLLRSRPAKLDELVELAHPAETYPQREAVLFALRELTGKDPGPKSADWQQVLASAQTPGRMDAER